mmetsp:Transcript_49320/g.116201  ORF Transcript_49320/g.116201 Transcript_49320/m.116201 type:complete len:164 (-) Transcript_49320:79-570(-)
MPTKAPPINLSIYNTNQHHPARLRHHAQLPRCPCCARTHAESSLTQMPSRPHVASSAPDASLPAATGLPPPCGTVSQHVSHGPDLVDPHMAWDGIWDDGGACWDANADAEVVRKVAQSICGACPSSARTKTMLVPVTDLSVYATSVRHVEPRLAACTASVAPD